MFIPARKEVFRWETPDPADDWMMVGHLFVRESGLVFIDPPLVPGLVEYASKLGKPEAVLLTTQNHTRAAKYIAKKAGIPVYLPDQEEGSLDPREVIAVKAIGEYEVYGTGKVLGFESYKFGDDYALISDHKEFIVGDNAAGDRNGNVLVAPEWFPKGPPYPEESAFPQEFKDSTKTAFKEIVLKTGAKSLIASHGYNVYDKLQEMAKKL